MEASRTIEWIVYKDDMQGRRKIMGTDRDEDLRKSTLPEAENRTVGERWIASKLEQYV